MTPQPSPKPGKIDVTPLVMADLQSRSDVGLETYGVRLQTHNGRDALLDAYHEGLDMCLYLKQAILERGS
jgi:hypothetical protein